MCVFNYNGYLCGHPRDGPIPPILCQQHNRHPHEPMCKPLRYNIKLDEAVFCDLCNEGMTAASEHWSAQTTQWREQKKDLTETVIQQLNMDRARALARVFTDGIAQGPTHTGNLQLLRVSQYMQVEAEEAAEELERSRRDWEMNIEAFTRFGLVPAKYFEDVEEEGKAIDKEYENRVAAYRKYVFDLPTESQDDNQNKEAPNDTYEKMIQRFCTQRREVMQRLRAKHRSLEPKNEDWDVVEEMEAVDVSDVYSY